MSKVKALFHIVFCTKKRQGTITSGYKEDLYRFVWKIVVDNNSRLIRIGGIENHVHLLVDLHPSISLSDFVMKIKSLSSTWMKSSEKFPKFWGWASEYYACTISPEQQDAVVEYIKGQEMHHKGTDFSSELKSMHSYANLDYYDGNMQ
ncbi:MAG: IS200/IS605 family transposase [Clostridium sp.]|nr:IS200/IS605 family transposase [Clostridium sp.]